MTSRGALVNENSRPPARCSALTRPDLTRVPDPRVETTYPPASSIARAYATVPRATPSTCASSRCGGKVLPAGTKP